MEILMQQLLHNGKIYAVCQSFFIAKNSLRTGSWLQSFKMTGHEGACFDYTII